MPAFLAIPFPRSIRCWSRFGPLAIRWYALAYIAGLLLGWRYRRAGSPTAARAGMPPLTRADVDDFLVWATLGVILGGRHRLRAVLQPALSTSRIPLPSSRSGRAACRSTAGCSASCVAIAAVLPPARHPICCAFGDLIALRRADRPVPRAASPTSSTASCSGRPTDVPWAMVFPNGGAAAAPSEPALRGGARRACVLFVVLRCCWRARASGAERPACSTGVFLRRLRPGAHLRRVLPPARRAARLPVRRHDHGAVLSVPMLLARPLSDRRGALAGATRRAP